MPPHDGVNNIDLNIRLTEILTSHETAEARFEALAELQAEALLQLPLSQRPRDPALVWDAAVQALQEFAASGSVPHNPAALLKCIFRRRVHDALRRELRDEQGQTSLLGEDGDLLPEVHRESVQDPAPPQVTDTVDRILLVVDRLCADVQPCSREASGYHLLRHQILNGGSLEEGTVLRARAGEAGFTPSAIASVLKRFRSAVRNAIHLDPELQNLLK